MADDTLAGPMLPPRRGSEPQIGQHNILDWLLRQPGQPAADMLLAAIQGHATPRQAAWEFMANGPVGPFGMARRPEWRLSQSTLSDLLSPTTAAEAQARLRSMLAEIQASPQNADAIRRNYGLTLTEPSPPRPPMPPSPAIAEVSPTASSPPTQRRPAATPEQLESLRAQGLTAYQIGERLGMHPETVWSSFRRYGLTSAPPPPRPPGLMSRISEMRTEGQSYSEIASELGLTRNQVAGAIRDLRLRGDEVP